MMSLLKMKTWRMLLLMMKQHLTVNLIKLYILYTCLF